MEKPPEVISLTKEEFDGLLEYSCSQPTGTDFGKRWKMNNGAHRGPLLVPFLDIIFAFPFPDDWWMGEYIDVGIEGKVGIAWKKVISGFPPQRLFGPKDAWGSR